jgi:hypothetical protein
MQYTRDVGGHGNPGALTSIVHVPSDGNGFGVTTGLRMAWNIPALSDKRSARDIGSRWAAELSSISPCASTKGH